jgi:hypothetical protein
MLQGYRDTILVFLVQCLIALGLFVFFQSWLVTAAVALISVPIVLQFFWDATRRNTTGAVPVSTSKTEKSAGRHNAPKNFLFPAFLLNRPVPTALVLLLIAVAPFTVSLLAGEPVDQQYLHSDHNSVTNLLSNLANMLVAITLLILLARPKELREFILNGYHNQNITNALLLDLCLIHTTAFIFTSSFAGIQEPAASYPLLLWHPLINSVCIMLGLYFGLAAPACLIMFMVSRRGRADRKIFNARDLILLEPFLIYAFIMGLRSNPPDNLFGFFVILCPLGIFLITEGIELMGIETSEERRLKLMPLTFKTRFAIVNLIIYTIIISMKFEIIQLTFALSTVGVALLVFYFSGLYQERKQHQRIVKKIRTLNAELPTSERFDQKVHIYHELRERR